MKTVTPFPYEDLQQLNSQEVGLGKKLLQIYETSVAPSAILPLVGQCFQDMLGGEVRLKVIGAESRKIETVISDLGTDSIVALLRMDPLPQKAMIGFDPLLAQFLVASVLTGKHPAPDLATELKLKPLTVLQEAVVEYIMIDLLERIASKLGRKSFTPIFEDIVRGTERLATVYTQHENLAFLPVKLTWQGHDFYLKCFLPIVAADKMGLTRAEASFVRARIEDLGSFPAEVSLEVGSVTLSPADWDTVEVGDIIFFDELTVGIQDGQLIGKGRLMLAGNTDAGFIAKIAADGDKIEAKLESKF